MNIIKRMKIQQKKQKLAREKRYVKKLREAKSGVVILDEAWFVCTSKSHPTIQAVENVGSSKRIFNYGTTGYGKNSNIPLADRKPVVIELLELSN